MDNALINAVDKMRKNPMMKMRLSCNPEVEKNYDEYKKLYVDPFMKEEYLFDQDKNESKTFIQVDDNIVDFYSFEDTTLKNKKN